MPIDKENIENVKLLAKAVMGWRESIDNNGYAWWAMPDGSAMPQDHWNPYTSIADAMEMLVRIKHYDIRGRDDHIEVETWRALSEHTSERTRLEQCGDVSLPGNDLQSLCAAVCAACLEWARAQGEKK